MLTLTIKIIEKPEGIFFSYEPCDQASGTYSETMVASIMLTGLEEAMKLTAKGLDCPLKLMSIDDPRNKK